MSAVDFTSVDFTRCAVNFTVPYLLTWERRTRPNLVDTLTLLVAELAHR